MNSRFRIKIALFLINHFLSVTHFWKIKNCLLRWAGCKIGNNTSIVGPIYFSTKVFLSIGDNCWVGRDFHIEGDGKVSIGNNCNFAPSVVLLTGTHEIGNYQSRAGKGITRAISIGDGNWLCARCMVLPGVRIGSMNIIAAGAVVNRNITNDVLVAGVPAKIVRKLEQ